MPADHSPRYRWWLIAMLWVVCFFNYADRQALSSVLPLLASDKGFDPFQLGLIGSAFAWVYAAGAPVAGIAADRFSRKRLIIGACIVWSCCTLATGWAGGYVSLLVARALTGLGETFYFPAAMALIGATHGIATRSRAMSWHQSAVYCGTVLGSWIAALLGESYGWSMPFVIFGPIGALYAMFLVFFLREPGPSHSGTAAPLAGPPPRVLHVLRSILRTPAAVLLMAGFLCANFVAVIFLTWTPMFLVEKFHFHLASAGLSGTVFIQIASAITVPFAGMLADRLALRTRAARMIVQIGGLILGAAPILIVGSTASITTLVIMMSLFGVCKGLYDSGIFASLYDVIDPAMHGTAAGLMNTVGWLGGALGPVFVGLATHYGHATAVENMSEAIAAGGYVYVLAAVLLTIAASTVARRSVHGVAL